MNVIICRRCDQVDDVEQDRRCPCRSCTPHEMAAARRRLREALARGKRSARAGDRAAAAAARRWAS